MIEKYRDHTPGLWNVEKPFDVPITCVSTKKQQVAVVEDRPGLRQSTIDANARLIADAPVLLKAFELAVDKLDVKSFCVRNNDEWRLDCERGLDCFDCMIAHFIQQAESDVENGNND
jgi:hypothetical protein